MHRVCVRGMGNMARFPAKNRRFRDRLSSRHSLAVTLLITACQLVLVFSQPQNAPGYLGCYQDCSGGSCDDDDRALQIGPMKNHPQSVEWCFTRCLDDFNSSYKYAGLKNRNKCFCGNDENYDRYGNVSDTDCNKKCSGNTDQYCGARGLISIYRISEGVCSNDIGPPTNGSHTVTNPRSLTYNLDNFKFFGTRVSFSCDHGYILRGAPSIECNQTDYNNVTWSDSIPSCEVNLTTPCITYTSPEGSTSRQSTTTAYSTSSNIPRCPTNSPLAGKLGTGEIAGIAVGVLAAVAVMIAALACRLRRERIRKTEEPKETDIALDTVGAHCVNLTLPNNHLADTSDTEHGQDDRYSAPPVYSEVIKRRPAEEGASAPPVCPPSSGQGDDDTDCGWVDNELYGGKLFARGIEARSTDADEQTDDQPPTEEQTGWAENIIYDSKA